MKYILGKKKEMTQRFSEDGKVAGVTVVEAGPCVVTELKTQDRDGYTAVQVGFEKAKKAAKPQKGQMKETGAYRILKEFRMESDPSVNKKDVITVSVFEPGERVVLRGVSKGKGFQGVVKRHGFHGSPASHGHKDQLRMPGSIGATDAARVFKGTRMAGQMGNEKVTIQNIKIIEVDPKKNLLYLEGSVPGARNSYVSIEAEGDMDLKAAQADSGKEPKEPEEPQKQKKEDSSEEKAVKDTGNKTEKADQADGKKPEDTKKASSETKSEPEESKNNTPTKKE